jgi:DNA-binding NtrC family response regulator
MDQQRARVLVIDDDPLIARAIARTLAAEHDVLVRASARDALEGILAGERYDLVLCDLSMPGMDGVGFYERVNAVAPDLLERVVVMTGGAFTPRHLAFLEETTVPRLEKPFLITELRALVEDRLSRVEGGTRSGATVGSRADGS